jgi:hypothetical protein
MKAYFVKVALERKYLDLSIGVIWRFVFLVTALSIPMLTLLMFSKAEVELSLIKWLVILLSR